MYSDEANKFLAATDFITESLLEAKIGLKS